MVEELRQVIWNFLWALPLAQVRFCGKGGQGGLCYGTSEANVLAAFAWDLLMS